jgi:hypothetical protein
MSNEKKYWHQYQESTYDPTWGHLQSVIAEGIDQWGVDVVYIPLEGRTDPTKIDVVWGEMKEKIYDKGYGMRLMAELSVDPNQQYMFSHFGYMDITHEQVFYITLREFYQRMNGWNDVTETDILNGDAPTGYNEDNIINVHPNVGDLIWMPLFNTMYQLTLVDDKASPLWQKYSIWKCTAKKLIVDATTMKVDITGSEGHGLVTDALDIAPQLPKINGIENVEKLTPTSVDPTQTGNENPDAPPKPINKNIEIEKAKVECKKDPNSTKDIFGDF